MSTYISIAPNQNGRGGYHMLSHKISQKASCPGHARSSTIDVGGSLHAEWTYEGLDPRRSMSKHMRRHFFHCYAKVRGCRASLTLHYVTLHITTLIFCKSTQLNQRLFRVQNAFCFFPRHTPKANFRVHPIFGSEYRANTKFAFGVCLGATKIN